MSILLSFLRSVLLTSLFSFATPSLLLGLTFACLSLLSYLPGLEELGQYCSAQLLQFLTIFGNGHPFQGVVVIGLTCSLVGALFDTYAFYQCQNLHSSH